MFGWAILLQLLIAKAAAAVITDLNQLSLDTGDRLYNHQLLFYGDAHCHAGLADLTPALREVNEMSENVARQIFGHSEGDCLAACLTRGTHVKQLAHPLPHHMTTTSAGIEDWVTNSCQKAEVGFLSYWEEWISINWVNGEGQRVNIGTLKQGEKHTSWQQTYLGHRFDLVDMDNKKLVMSVVVEYDGIYPIGRPQSTIQQRDVEYQVKKTFEMEWERANRVKRTFTEYGFNKGRLPDDLWGSISAYHYNNRDHKVLEEWDTKGVFVNWWERDVYFIPMPWELKKLWQLRLKALVEQWSGIPLELTDIYGMRRYEDGARLLTHVDREETHAASLIINVAQSAIRKPWKVEIYDFDNRLHEIEMDEGDIVYYESARCLHGRMAPLEGGFYVNLFAHYRPVGDPKWYQKENPEGTPEQQHSLGVCSIDKSAPRGISCSNGETPPYLSPYLETLHGHEDLYHFWKMVEPKTQFIPKKSNRGRSGHGGSPGAQAHRGHQHSEF